MPGCKGCGKTPHGGVTRDVVEAEAGDRYEVRDESGTLLRSFGSVVAAATFMRGHPRAKVFAKRD